MATTRKFANDDAKLNVGAVIVARNRKYSDIDLSFEKNPATNDILKKKDANAVKESVKNLILTNYYERPYQPYIGTGIRDLLFQLNNNFMDMQLQKNIRMAIQNSEPRARIVNLIVDNVVDQNSINVTLEFQVVTTRELVTLSLTLDRLR